MADLRAQALPTTVERSLQLIKDLLDIFSAKDVLTLRKANRSYALHLLESACLGLQMRRASNNGFVRALHWWDRWRGKAGYEPDYATLQEELAAAHCWLSIVAAREAGKLPAWEGILLVRDLSEPNIQQTPLSPEEVYKRLIPEF